MLKRTILSWGLPLMFVCGGIVLAGATRPAASSQDRNATAPATRPAKSAVAFYIDEDTGEESVGSAAEVPPLVGSSGKPTVVRAIKTSVDGGKTAKTVVLEKYTAEAVEKLATLPAGDAGRAKILKEGLLVRSPAPGSPWVPAESAEGKALLSIPATAKIIMP